MPFPRAISRRRISMTCTASAMSVRSGYQKIIEFVCAERGNAHDNASLMFPASRHAPARTISHSPRRGGGRILRLQSRNSLPRAGFHRKSRAKARLRRRFPAAASGVRFPCVHAVATTPAQRLGVLLRSLHPAVSASPERVVGSACASSFSMSPIITASEPVRFSFRSAWPISLGSGCPCSISSPQAVRVRAETFAAIPVGGRRGGRPNAAKPSGMLAPDGLAGTPALRV